MTNCALKFIGQWVAAVLCTFAASLALAQPPHGHESWFGLSRGTSLWGAPNRAAGPVARPSARRAFMMSGDPYGHGAARMVPAPVVLPATIPLRPVSEEARTMAREGGAAYLRAGSIRADIARYNEEREATRPPSPPNGRVPRPPQSPSAYRN